MGTTFKIFGGVGATGSLWLVVALCLGGSSPAVAKSKWMVESKHLRSYERAKDCSVFKSVAWHALEDQRRRERNAKQIETLVKERRVTLEKCGVTRGLPTTKSMDNLTDDEDRALAEMCPGPYANWLAPGYRLYSIRHEMREYDDALETIKVVLRFRCAEKDIREVKWNLPSEVETENAAAGSIPADRPSAYLDGEKDAESLSGPTAKLTTPATTEEVVTAPQAAVGVSDAAPAKPAMPELLAPPTAEFEKAVE